MARQSIWDLIADIAVEHIQREAKNRGEVSDLREEYARLMSERDWNNRDFNKLIDAFEQSLEAIEEVYSRSRNDRPEDILEDAIPELIDGHFAEACLANKDVANGVSDETYRSMKKLSEKFRYILDGGRRRDDRRDDRDYGRGRGRDDRDYRDDRGYGRSSRDDRDDRGGRYRDDRGYDRRDERSRHGGGWNTSHRDLGRTRRDDDRRDGRDSRYCDDRRDSRKTSIVNGWEVLDEIKEQAQRKDDRYEEPRREEESDRRSERDERDSRSRDDDRYEDRPRRDDGRDRECRDERGYDRREEERRGNDDRRRSDRREDDDRARLAERDREERQSQRRGDEYVWHGDVLKEEAPKSSDSRAKIYAMDPGIRDNREVEMETTKIGCTLDITQERPYDDFWVDGEHWKPFWLSGWKLTERDNDPLTTVPTVFNVNRQIKFFVKDARGVVREEHLDLNDQMRYLQHELLTDTSKLVENKNTAAVSLKPKETGFVPDIGDEEIVPQKKAEKPRLMHILMGIAPDQTTMQAAKLHDSMDGCVFATHTQLRRNQKAAPEDNLIAHHDYHLVRTPLVASGWEQLKLIEKVYDTSGLAQAAAMLKELKPKFDEHIWKALNKRYSDLLLHALKYQFQYTAIKGLSFANDWPLVIDHITKHRGQEYATQFAQRVAYLSSIACRHVAQDEVAEIASDLMDKDDPLPAVIFIDFVAMTAIDARLDELGFAGQLDKLPTGGTVTKASEKLRLIMREYYTNVCSQVQAPSKTRVYLTTSDNRVVEIIPYAGKAEEFILATIQ